MWNQNPDQIYNRGIQITSTNLITAYFEVGTINNPDIFSLKGRNALGEDFYVPFQDINYNEPLGIRPYSGIYLVATEDNTEIIVTPTNPVFPGRPAGVPFTLYLNRGQSIAIVPDNYDTSGNLPENRLAGTRVQSDKPIAVSTSDDSVRGLPGGCYDLIGDQLIPTKIIGTEYIAMRGRLTIPEHFYVLATEPNTTVEIDGVTEAVLQPGEQFRWEFSKQTYYIKTSKPSYVYHVAGFGCEQGGAVLPPVNVCTGSTRVSFTRSKGESFFLNILVRAGAEDGFIFQGQGPNTVIAAADFQTIPGTTKWLAAEFEFSPDAPVPTGVPVGEATLIENTKDVFHLAIINGGPGSGTMYGYFSDFNPLDVQANIAGTGTIHKACFGDPVQLIARGGTQYMWHPVDFLDDPTIPNPIALPDASIKYTVTVSGACNMVDSTSVFIEVGDPVAALFTIDQAEGCTPLNVMIHNESYGLSNYSWRMGDGTVYTTGASYFPHTFTNTTDDVLEREIMLVGRNTLLCRDTMRTTVRVYPEIHAVPQADVISGCAPLEVNFGNLSTGAESFTWRFGDGSSSTEETPTHVFHNLTNTEKTYRVILEAKSRFGCESQDTIDIVVQPYIETGFHVDPPVHCHPYPMEVTNTSYGATKYSWSFNGGNTFEEIDELQFTRTLLNEGADPRTYEIWLVGENDFGCEHITIRDITVNPLIKSDFTPDIIEGCNPLVVEFTNHSINANSFLWDFDNNEGTSSDIHPVVVFENPSLTDTAVFNVNLLATSEWFCFDEFEMEIRVFPRIRANFTYDYTSFCTPQEVTFYNTSVGGLNYYWDFGDGNTSQNNGDEIIHEYINNTDEEITFPVSLIIENASGCRDTVLREVTIFPEVKANFNMSTSGCHPLEVSFQNLSTGADFYYWDFDDGGSSQQFEMERTFTNNSHYESKIYEVRLVAESLFGCIDSIILPIVVYPKPKANYSVSDLSGCSPLTVDFTENALGATTFIWNFGDGTGDVTTQGDASHTYIHSGETAADFTTHLIVQNIHGCRDTLYQNLQIFPLITAGIDVSELNGCHPLEVNILNTSDGATAATPYIWSYGDGNYSTSQDLTQTYVFENFSHTETQDYTIRLNAESYYGCKDSTFVTVTVNPRPKAVFEPGVLEGCSPLPVQFNDASIGAGVYTWQFGNGNYSQQAGTVSHIFNQPHDQGAGEFNIELHVENQFGCDDVTSRQITVFPDITAQFDVVTEGCHPLQVSFDNFSLGVDQHTWILGDGTITNEINPDYTYFNESFITPEIYTVNLHTLSLYGCEAEISKQITVFPRPKSDFSVSITQGCSPLDVDIENLSIGGSNYAWILGGSTSYTQESMFTHVFRNLQDEPQSFTISLTTGNQYGCTRQSEKLINVYPEVHAAFTADNPFMAGCNPLDLNFENLSERAHQYQWSFGDGSHSTAANPSNIFFTQSTDESYYDVKLSAESVYGCKDSIVRQARVYPVPVADMFVSPQSQVFPDRSVVAENLSAPGSWQYHWDMGDGTRITKNENSPVEHTYNWQIGDYATRHFTVNLMVGNEFCHDTISQEVVILAPHPMVGFDPSEQGCPPLEVQFRNDTQYGLEFFWDFDDGNYSSEENPRHTFYDPGEYLVKLLVSGEGGIDSAYQTITVFEPPRANFRASPPVIQLPYQSVQMINLSSMGAYYEWHMGDGNIYYEYAPGHQYENPGEYDITLIVGTDTNPQCFDQITKQNAVIAEQHCKIVFPNAFTPNTTGPNGGAYIVNDPANHVFYPVHTGIQDYRLEIYNRWGEFLFRSEDIETGWDGYYRGRLSSMDVYVWKVWATCHDGTEIRDAGDVTLYR
ncbi:MAG: PKD domain-containing protein [Bacteroidales bacterium]|nr:PKD domain-containing protein [Bacteroidales bacterium]